MKALINRFIHYVAFVYWATRTSWHFHAGGWYVFRKAPNWFVIEVVESIVSQKESIPELAGGNPDFIPYMMQAIAEYRLRFPA